MQEIEVQDIQNIAYALAKKWLSFDEPIPDFRTRFPQILESCLKTPLQTYGKELLYPTLIKQVAMLFYLMIKNHPFQNGNKRIAVMTLLYVLYLENKWIDVAPTELYQFAVIVAGSSPDHKNTILVMIEDFIARYLVPFTPKRAE